VCDTSQPWETTQLPGSEISRKEWVRPNVGNDRVCVFHCISQGMMSIYPSACQKYTPVAQSTSHIALSLGASLLLSLSQLSLYLHTPSTRFPLWNWVVVVVRHWFSHRPVIEPVWRCTWMLWSFVLSVELGDWDQVNSEMHLEAMIVWGYTCNCRSKSNKIWDALQCQDDVNSEMPLQAIIVCMWKCTGSWKSSYFGDAPAGYVHVDLVM